MATVITEEKLRIASERNLTIVGQPTGEQSNSIKYLLYRFNSCGHLQNIDTNLVRLGRFKCRACEQEKLEKEATEHGLTLLERANKGNEALYRFNDCGHTRRIGYTAVRRGMFKCNECYYQGKTLTEKYTEEAAIQGLEYLGDSESSKDLGKYKRLSCGHIFNYQKTAVRASAKLGYGVACKICFTDDVSESLNKAGATLVNTESGNTTYRHKCGHVQTQNTCNIIKQGAARCKECHSVSNFLRYSNLALENNLEFVGESSNGNSDYKRFKMPCCGENQDISVYRLKLGDFICKKCNGSRLDRETFLYIFRIEDKGKRWLKVGIAMDTDKRVTQYGLTNNAEVDLVFSKLFVDGYSALAVEQHVHRVMKSHKIDPEIMKDFHTKSGFTECYPTGSIKEIQDNILNYIQEEVDFE